MADISKITLPNGASYDFKDATARAGKQNIRNGNAMGNVDWNTLTTAGTYKIQNTTMTADYNAPVGEYAFGILVVFDSESGGENRLLQIYFPHYVPASKQYMHMRMRNNNDWSSWRSLSNDADTVDGKHASDFASASHTHTKSQITDFPTIPTKTSQLTNDSGFKTTDTWRGIQNNLTSDSTTDSLSAAQGKVLKGLVDGKASSSHTHSEYAAKSKYGDTTIDVGRKANTTVGEWSTAEGNRNTASGICSHAEGDNTTASGGWSHAEGSDTIASKQCAHAEGVRTTASGANSHAEGQLTTASGANSHAGGWCTEALHDNEVSYGKCNKSSSDTLFSIGDGTAIDARHNAFEITKTGGKLHDKDIATTDLIPTELPANGGNADTVDGLHASNFVNYTGRNFAQVNDPAYRVPYECIINSSDVKNTGLPDAKYWHIKYFMHSDSNGYGCQLAFPLNGSDYRPRYRTSFEMTWDEWKEISTTPIKSTDVSGTTNGNGDIYLWGVYTGNIPISACGSADTVFSPFLNNDVSKYMLHVIDVYTNSPVTNKSVNATVYYF